MNIKNRVIALFFLIGIVSICFGQGTSLISRTDVQNFINKMVEEHHFDREALNKWLGSASVQSSILTAIAKPAEKLPWYRYQPIFLTPERIEAGVKFWKANQQLLKQAEVEYGVPPEIIVAILGVETFYGRNIGKYSILDSLVTLGFHYPPRAAFFLSELEEFLILAREENWDPTQVKGSYAGAMGKGQFISSSYRRYAIDFNKNGKRDLFTDNADTIGSVANYFKIYGWKSGAPIVVPANITGEAYQDILASSSDPTPKYSLDVLAKHHILPVHPPQAPWQEESFALINLEGENGPEFWLGTQNFYVITRYNHSNLYAMAVYHLSQRIKEIYSTTV